MSPTTENSLQKHLHFLAISGSLRAASSNTIVLKAIIALAPENITITLYESLGDLPHFNPDLDGETPPNTVADFRARLKAADGVLICSPEYAHGVPGVMKNALDWIVSSGEFMDKPVALLNAKPHSTHAQASLKETLTVMMADIIPEASIDLPLATNRVDEEGILSTPALSAALQNALAALAQAAQQAQT